MGFSLPMSTAIACLCCASALLLVGFVSCEDEPQVQPRVRRAVRASAPAASSGLERYHTLGNGLQVAPDWIKGLDPNMMRRSNQPLEGFRLGHALSPSVIIERGELEWRLVLLEQPPSSPDQTQHAGQRVELSFKGAPTSNYKQSGEFSDRSVEWSIPKSLTPNDLRRWRAQSAYLLELIDWDIKPFDPEGPTFQEAGKASGRLMLRAKDERGGEGWVVGRFDDALVRYLGDPKLWERAHLKP